MFYISDAACARTDPEQFFPEKGEPNDQAKTTCGRCPIIADCLAYALERPYLWGVWGGTTAKERSRLRRDHHATAQPSAEAEGPLGSLGLVA